MSDTPTSAPENDRSPLLRASHVLLVEVVSMAFGPWKPHPEKGFRRVTTLELKLAEVLKGEVMMATGTSFSHPVVQFDARSPIPLPPMGVWSAVDLEDSKRLVLFCRGEGDDIKALLDETACLLVMSADFSLNALRLALRAQDEEMALCDLFDAAAQIADRLDVMFVDYLDDRIDGGFFQGEAFEKAMKLVESQALAPQPRAALLNLLRNRVSRSQQARAEHVNRLAVALFRLTTMKEAAVLHGNLRDVFLPNLLGLRGGGRKLSVAEVFRDYPEERDALQKLYAREKQLSGATPLRQWLAKGASPDEETD
jgi:hypothetical protein